MHEKGVCHRDIKPSNILITKDRQRVFIADFNVAKKVKLEEGQGFKLYTKSAGTLAFVAPERLKENQEYTEKVDMWAAGLVLVMLLTGSHPFDMESTTAKLFQDIMDGERIVADLMFFNDSLSQEGRDLVTKLVRTDPEERLSAEQALEDPWFKIDFGRKSNLL